MVQTVYEGRQYSHSKLGWEDEKGILVPYILGTFLSRQAMGEGVDPSLFGGKKTLDNEAKVTVVKRKESRVSSSIMRKGISLDD